MQECLKVILPSNMNIVILAANYNPSIISKEWLFQKDIFTEVIKNFVHTPVFALVDSEDFSLVVDERRLQLTVRKVIEDNVKAAGSIAERFVSALPETPYRAVGLNHHYTFSRETCDLGAILSANDAKVHKLFSAKYELGATVVFEFEKFIVTFTVSPSLSKEQQVRLSFNFHSDTSNVHEIKERLCSQLKTLEKAESIIQGLSRNG